MLRGLIAATFVSPVWFHRGSAQLGTAVMAALACLAVTFEAGAQSWEPPRTRPVLLDVGTVDRTGEDDWLFGAEDVAGDGLGTFEEEEQAIDFRTAYAVAGEQDLWLRAYVSSADGLGDVRLFVFVDSDRDSATGGSAEATSLDERFDGDPTVGGYEYVVAVTGDEELEGIWRWSEAAMDYEPVEPISGVVEVGVDVDPVRIGPAERGYLQFAVPLTDLELTSACDAELFVRSLNETPDLGSGDLDVGRRFRCIPHGEDANERPEEIVPQTECTGDDQCPGDGLCLDGRCVVPPLCRENADCGDDEVCDDGVCVFDSSTTACSDDAECGDLVCDEDAALCAACSGDASCGDGRRCAATGRCVDGADAAPPGGDDSDGVTLGEGEKIQGGAFTCAWAQRGPGWFMGSWSVALGTLGLGVATTLRRRRKRTALRGAEAGRDRQ